MKGKFSWASRRPLRGALTVLTLAAIFFGAALISPVHAQDYPSRPIRLVVPYSAGGPADLVARYLAQKLGVELGQPLIVENRGGADGAIGSDMVARAAPDGYTLLFGTIQTHGVNPSLKAHLPYDPVKDFVAVASATTFPFVLVVNPDLPVRSVAELIDYVRHDPGKFNYSSAGTGTGTHLAGELFKSMAHLDIVHVPFKGGGEALTDVMAGRIQLTFTGIPASIALIKAGKLRPLAVTGTQPVAGLPGIPTVAATLPGFDVTSWNGFFAPAGTPSSVVERLNGAVGRVLDQPEVRKQLDAQGAQPMVESTLQFTQYVKDEVDKWRRVIASAGIQPD
jgi:tripartite-type tricarboxylate transporter receptor subunit TctC